jgi:hypothetical protein
MAHVIRCTGCTADYQPHEVPPTCTRCGSSAGWCQINLPDEFSAAVDAVLADVGREVTPEERAEAIREKMLGDREAKPLGMCSQVGCTDGATHRYTWPGNPESLACPLHASAAARVADAMGFFLEVAALETIDAVYDEAPTTPRDMPER